jgi:sec-independent protein translocase protein TatA
MGLDNPLHIAFLLIIALLVFGAKRLPEMGRSLGAGMRGFKQAISGEDTPAALVAVPAPPEAAAQAATAHPMSTSGGAGDIDQPAHEPDREPDPLVA